MLSSLLEKKRVVILLVVVILAAFGILGYYFSNQATNKPSSSATSIPVTTQIGTAEQAIIVSAVSEIPDITIHSFNTNLLLSFLEMIEYGPETGAQLWGKRGVFQGHNIHIVFTDIKNKPEDALLYLEIVDLEGNSISGTQSSYNPDTKTITYTLYNKVFPQATTQEIARTWSYQVMQMFYFFKNTTVSASDQKAFESQLRELMPRNGEQLFVITNNTDQQTVIPKSDSLLVKAMQFLAPAQAYAQNCNGYFECGRQTWYSDCENGSACIGGECATGGAACEEIYTCAPLGHQSCGELLGCTNVAFYCQGVAGTCAEGHVDTCGYSNPPPTPTPTPTPTPEPSYAWCGNCDNGTCSYRTHTECNASGYGTGGCSGSCGSSTPTPTLPPPPTPTPLPAPSCTIALDYVSINRGVGEIPLAVAAYPSNVQNGSVSSVSFSTSPSSIATVSPSSDTTNPYQTALDPTAIGSTTLTANVYMGGASPVCSTSTGVTIRAPQCNDTCTANADCASGLSCKTTYNFPATFTDVTSGVSSVGNASLPIFGFRSYNTGSNIRQHILRGPGSVWTRTSTVVNGSAVWGNWTLETDVPGGAGVITSYSASLNAGYSLLTKYAVKNGILYTKNYISDWSPAGSSALPPLPATTTLLAYSVHYDPAQQYTTTFAITEDNEFNTIWTRSSAAGNTWTDSTQTLVQFTGSNPSSGNTFTDMNLFDYPTGYVHPAGTLGHYIVRGERVLHRVATQNTEKRCRLNSRPNSGSCQAPTTIACAATPCNSTTLCAAGLRCMLANNGNRYCSVPDYEATCAAFPSNPNCCQAPPPPPPCTVSCTTDCGSGTWGEYPDQVTNVSIDNRNSVTAEYNVSTSNTSPANQPMLRWEKPDIAPASTVTGYDVWILPYTSANPPGQNSANSSCVNTANGGYVGGSWCRYMTVNSGDTINAQFLLRENQTNHFKVFIRARNETCSATPVVGLKNGPWSAPLEVKLMANVTGTAYQQSDTAAGNNDCPAATGSPVTIQGTNSTITAGAYSATITGSDYSITLPYYPNPAWQATSVNPQLNLGSGLSSYTCNCPNGCAHTDTYAPITGQNFFLSPLDLSSTAWWQTTGGNVYAANTITADIPTSCEDSADCNANLITGNSAGDERSAGIPLTNAADINVNGFFTEYAPSQQPRATGVNFSSVAQENYAHFAKKFDLSAAQTITSPLTNLPSEQNTDEEAEVFYYSGNSLTVEFPNGTEVPSDRKIIIFVNGDLIVDSNNPDERVLSVADGGFISFIVSGNITFAENLGRLVTGTPPVVTTPNIPVVAGVFVADGTITINGYSNPLSQDLKFIGEGTFVGWSGITIGRNFENDSNPLAAFYNTVNATSVFMFRPDFLQNIPEILKSPNVVWQETN